MKPRTKKGDPYKTKKKQLRHLVRKTENIGFLVYDDYGTIVYEALHKEWIYILGFSPVLNNIYNYIEYSNKNQFDLLWRNIHYVLSQYKQCPPSERNRLKAEAALLLLAAL